jgi:hypothetical protein
MAKFSHLARPQRPTFLAASLRPFRAESLCRLMESLLDGNAEAGRERVASSRQQYPIMLKRSTWAARRHFF